MNLIQRAKTLWKMAGAGDAAERLEGRVGDLSQSIAELGERLAVLAKNQETLEGDVHTLQREAESIVGNVRQETSELCETLNRAETETAAKVRELADRAESVVSDVRCQIEACREEAGQLAPEIRRIEDAMQKLNG